MNITYFYLMLQRLNIVYDFIQHYCHSHGLQPLKQKQNKILKIMKLNTIVIFYLFFKLKRNIY